jgi:general secretion pathway protein B
VEKPPKPRPAETVADKQPVEDQDGGSHAYRINVIAYASAPEERFAIIDMTRYITGDRLPDGAVVEAIEQNGVVLKRNGRLIRIRH